MIADCGLRIADLGSERPVANTPFLSGIVALYKIVKGFYNSSTLRKFLLALALIVLNASGCGDQAGSPPPPGPVVFRQKISAPKDRVSEAVKPDSKVSEVESELAGQAEPPAGRPAEGTVEAEAPEKPPLKEAKVEPPSPEKKPLLELPEAGPRMLAEVIEQKVAYLYDPKGKLDPFQPVFVKKALLEDEVSQKIRKKRLPLTPLEKVDLSQLKLVGIIVSPTGNKALVEEPSGKGYVITRGTYVGTNFGQVKKILKDRVIVEEEVEDFVSGKMKPQTTELRLQKRPGDV